MANEKRKRLKATIADAVKRSQGKTFTEGQQKMLAKQLLNIFDGDSKDTFESNSARQIPAIIALTYEYQLDTTTSKELSDQAERLRALARKATTLGDGIELGMALENSAQSYLQNWAIDSTDVGGKYLSSQFRFPFSSKESTNGIASADQR